MIDFAQARRTMVDCQLRTYDVTDRALLAAMDEVPRERFVRAGQETFAYSDGPVEDSGAGRLLLAPMVLARLIQALGIESGQRVLDIAGGGYSAAVLARLGAEVTALDNQKEALDRPAAPGPAGPTTFRTGPLQGGCPDLAPFDAILINGAIEDEPTALLDQLAEGGRLACIRRDGRLGQALVYMKANGAVSFRPLFDAVAPVLADFARPRGFVF